MKWEKKSKLDTADALGHSPYNLENSMSDFNRTLDSTTGNSFKPTGKVSVPREMYRDMEAHGMNMDSYRIKGERGGLLKEYSQANPECPLTLFIESMDGQTQWTHKRSDGTVFNIRINGANEKA